MRRLADWVSCVVKNWSVRPFAQSDCLRSPVGYFSEPNPAVSKEWSSAGIWCRVEINVVRSIRWRLDEARRRSPIGDVTCAGIFFIGRFVPDNKCFVGIRVRRAKEALELCFSSRCVYSRERRLPFINRTYKVALFNKVKYLNPPRKPFLIRATGTGLKTVTRRKSPSARLIIVIRKTKLTQVILTLRLSSRFSSALNGREKQCDKDADNRNHHQQFD